MFRLRRYLRRDEDPADREKQLRIDYGQTFGSEPGRRVLSDILDQGLFFQPTHLPGSTSQDTAFREGRRSICLLILENLQAKDIEKLQEYAE